MDNYDDCIVFLLAKAYQRAHSVFKKRLSSYGLTPIQHLVLEALWMEEGISAGELGRRLALDAATLSGVLDRLADNNWIDKRPDSIDRRIVRVFLSDKGKDKRPDLSNERELANIEIMNELTFEERVLLKRLLRDIRV